MLFRSAYSPDGSMIAVGSRRRANHCGTCNRGYYINSSKSCVAFGGTCSGGALRDQTKRVGQNDCGGCNPGYQAVRETSLKLSANHAPGDVALTCRNNLKPRSACEAYCDTAAACNGFWYYTNGRCCLKGGWSDMGGSTPYTRWARAIAGGDGFYRRRFTCSAYAGTCANGALKAQANRRMDNHCKS